MSALLLLLMARGELEDGLSLVRRARFEQAIPLLRGVLYPPSVSSEELRDARVGLAQAYFYTGQVEAARNELRLLFRKHKNATAERAAPDFAEFFEATRDETVPPKPRTKPRVREGASVVEVTSVPASLPASMPASAPRVLAGPPREAPAPWYLKVLPFGGGQFANGDRVGGAVFLSLGLGLLALNIVTAVVNARMQDASGRFPADTRPVLYVTQQASAGATIVCVALGIVDAFVWSPSRR